MNDMFEVCIGTLRQETQSLERLLWNTQTTDAAVDRVVKLPVIYVGGKLPVTYR